MAGGKHGLAADAEERLARLRRRYPFLDHLIAMREHYTKVEGNVLAGAVTYFGFLSFFLILALAFAVIGYVSVAYPEARDWLRTAIEQLLPGIVSSSGEPGTISLDDIEDARAAAGIIGFLGVLYSGLGWVSCLRTALQDTFQVPRSRKPNFLLGKLTDLVVLAVLGVVMIVSVGISGVVKGLAGDIVDLVGLDDLAIGSPIVWSVGILLGLAASTVLFYVMYALLASPGLPPRPLWQGALVGAVAFELLKLIVVYVLGGVGGSAFAPLAIAITLVVWINYCSRVVLYSASWGMTSRHSAEAITRRTTASEAAVAAAELSPAAPRVPVSETVPAPAGRFDAGSAVLGAVAGALAAIVLGRRG
jgi:membrane protein